MEEVSTPSASSDGRSVLHGSYELGRIIGHGTFAKVHIARNLRTSTNVALKVVAKDMVMRVGMTEQIKREISVMKLLSHPNIVELHEVMATRSKIYIAMELVRGGELFAVVARSGRLPDADARHYFRQLISAVDFCHSRGVYHRDLKPENLLLDDDGNLKVADFGLSTFGEHVRRDGLLYTACGTPAYAAPEVVGSKGYDGAKADLWSCGVILFVLLAGSLPFPDDNLIAMHKKIHRGDFRCPPWFSPEARRLIARLLDPNPATRMTIPEIMDSTWFKAAAEAAPPPPVKEKEPEEPEKLNAFHLIALSEGFDLSPLFEGTREEGMRFATRETASGVISRLEGMAARTEGRFRVTRSRRGGVRLEGEGEGRKGRLAVAAEILVVAPSVVVVELRKDAGDTLEYRRFCSNELRPALKDILWASSDSQTAAGG